jgi:DNA (cytosine-5)-methyltransferase 1
VTSKWAKGSGGPVGNECGLFVAQPIAFDAYNQTTSETVTALRCAAGGVFDNTVAQPIAFAQNTRDEVRIVNGDGNIVGALSAQPGMKQTSYVALPTATLQPIAFSGQMSNPQTDVDMTQTLGAKNPMAVAQPVYELHSQDSRVRELGDVCTTVSATYGAGGGNVPITLMPAMAVRRLTPVECERLQGFADGYTDIQSKGKPTPDGPRYKALGNSMAVPVMAWIGKRIQAVDALL